MIGGVDHMKRVQCTRDAGRTSEAVFRAKSPLCAPFDVPAGHSSGRRICRNDPISGKANSTKGFAVRHNARVARAGDHAVRLSQVLRGWMGAGELSRAGGHQEIEFVGPWEAGGI
jgi:hypothetical protein